MRRLAGLAGALCVFALAACSHKTEPSAAAFSAALNRYLERHGDLCMAKSTWPIDVSAHDVAIGTRNALQMPVLERLGLVASSAANAAATEGATEGPQAATTVVRRYALTAEGRKYYVARPSPVSTASRAGAEGAVPAAIHADFCAAKLSLDKVVGWKMRSGADGAEEAIVSYTYRVEPAPWTREAEAARVFPVVARVAAGAGTAQLQEAFRRGADGWVAKDL